MKEIKITIYKEEVYEEVAKATAYTGAKMVDDTGTAYDRIATIDADRDLLERFWDESCMAVCDALNEYLAGNDNGEKGLSIELSLPNNFNPELADAMRQEVFSFFVANIVGNWYLFCNKEEASAYTTMAAGMLEGMKRKSNYRIRPRRPEN